MIDISTALDTAGWSVDPTAVQNVTATVGDVQSVEVTLGGAKPLSPPLLFVRVQAAP